MNIAQFKLDASKFLENSSELFAICENEHSILTKLYPETRGDEFKS